MNAEEMHAAVQWLVQATYAEQNVIMLLEVSFALVVRATVWFVQVEQYVEVHSLLKVYRRGLLFNVTTSKIWYFDVNLHSKY